MPIQFRCGACQQLLGIARRKAGKVVDCPTCGKRTLVPLEDPLESGVTEPIPPPLPPVQRQAKGGSIFDRVDVEKLLQPPLKPDVFEESETATALAEPPRKKKVKREPEPIPEVPIEKPKVLEPLAEPETEPEKSEPFPLIAQVPTLRPVPKAKSNLHLLLGALGLVALGIGIFLAGHWFGSHRPLF
jgi:DNA-directed RNA polymerase subunit RPC12/RpoP